MPVILKISIYMKPKHLLLTQKTLSHARVVFAYQSVTASCTYYLCIF